MNLSSPSFGLLAAPVATLMAGQSAPRCCPFALSRIRKQPFWNQLWFSVSSHWLYCSCWVCQIWQNAIFFQTALETILCSSPAQKAHEWILGWLVFFFVLHSAYICLAYRGGLSGTVWVVACGNKALSQLQPFSSSLPWPLWQRPSGAFIQNRPRDVCFGHRPFLRPEHKRSTNETVNY